jgi:hypothetical protein
MAGFDPYMDNSNGTVSDDMVVYSDVEPKLKESL